MPRHVARYRHRAAPRNVGVAAYRAGQHLVRRHAGRVVAAGAKAAWGHMKKRFKRGPVVEKTRKLVVGNPGESHSGLGRATIKVGSRVKAKLLKRQKTVGRWKYTQTDAYNLVGFPGGQTATSLVSPLTVAKLLTSTGAAYNADQNRVALEQLNPYLANTGSAYLATVISPLTDRFIVIDYTLEVELTNFSGVGCYMDLYLCQAKKASNVNAIAQWSQGLLNNSGGQVVQTFPVAGSTASNVGSENIFMPGARPTEAKLFKDFWNVRAVKSLEFTGNSTERVHFDVGVNKVIKMQDVRAYGTSGMVFMPGVTWNLFAVARGALVVDNTVPLTQLITYGSTRVGCVVVEKYNMCGVMGNSSRIDITTATTNIPSGQTLSNQVFLNEVDAGSTVATGTVP